MILVNSLQRWQNCRTCPPLLALIWLLWQTATCVTPKYKTDRTDLHKNGVVVIREVAAMSDPTSGNSKDDGLDAASPNRPELDSPWQVYGAMQQVFRI
jgi:hypothetical protein